LPIGGGPAVVIVVINGVVIGFNAADTTLVYHRIRNVLEDVVFDQIVCAIVGVDPVTLGGGVPGGVEIAVSNRGVNRLVHPHVLVLASDVADILDPIVVAIHQESPADGGRIGVVHRQVLDAVVLHRQAVVPPGLRRLSGSDVRHSDSRRYADRPWTR